MYITYYTTLLYFTLHTLLLYFTYMHAVLHSQTQRLQTEITFQQYEKKNHRLCCKALKKGFHLPLWVFSLFFFVAIDRSMDLMNSLY